MERTLNRAFLRSFVSSQGTSGAIPPPHIVVHPHQPVDPLPDESNAFDPDVHMRAETPSPYGDSSNSIPAPHIAFQNAPPSSLSARESWITSDVASIEALYRSASIIVAPTVATPTPEVGPSAAPSRPMPQTLGDTASHAGDETESWRTAPASRNDPPLVDSPNGNSATTSSVPAGTNTRSPQGGAHRAVPLEPHTEHHIPELVPQHDPTSSPDDDDALESADTSVLAHWEVDRFTWPSNCEKLYRSLAVCLEEAGEQLRGATAEGLHVLGVTSAYRGEGRTTLALLLARAAAHSGVRVALIDADGENPQIGRQLRLQMPVDWRGVMEAGESLAEAAVASLEDRLVVFPLHPDARLDAPRWHERPAIELIRHLASRFDLLVVDLGPTDGAHRGWSGLEECPFDAVMVVRDVRTTPLTRTESVVEHLHAVGVEAVGIVENYTRDDSE